MIHNVVDRVLPPERVQLQDLGGSKCFAGLIGRDEVQQNLRSFC
jgi:hypothetical protein